MSSQKHRIPYTLSAPWLNSCSSVTRAMLLSWLIGKDPDAGKDWGQEEKGVTEDQMVGWYHWLNGHEFEQTPGDHEGQGSLVCCSSWGHKELDTTEQLNHNDNMLWTFNTQALYLCLLSKVTAIPLFSVNIISPYPFPPAPFQWIIITWADGKHITGKVMSSSTGPTRESSQGA